MRANLLLPEPGNHTMTQLPVLIVEDDPQLSRIFSLALASAFAVEVVQDGRLAMARLAESQPALVVLDLNLPEVDGEQILAYIRGEARLANTRVILTTADARRAEYLETQADVVLLKPLSPMALHDLAQRLLSQ
jgi:DNA-binding response OmpR family regulator